MLRGRFVTYAALEGSNKQALEDLAGLVAVADVFECLGRVLAADVEEDFLTTGVLVYEACSAREWSAMSALLCVEMVQDVLFPRFRVGERGGGNVLVQS